MTVAALVARRDPGEDGETGRAGILPGDRPPQPGGVRMMDRRFSAPETGTAAPAGASRARPKRSCRGDLSLWANGMVGVLRTRGSCLVASASDHGARITAPCYWRKAQNLRGPGAEPLAKERGVSPHTLLNLWLQEKVQEPKGQSRCG